MSINHSTLGVAPNADAADIKKAYRKLVKQYHPDANPDDPRAVERFREITAAYEALSNPKPTSQTPPVEQHDWAMYEKNLDDFVAKGGIQGIYK